MAWPDQAMHTEIFNTFLEQRRAMLTPDDLPVKMALGRNIESLTTCVRGISPPL